MRQAKKDCSAFISVDHADKVIYGAVRIMNRSPHWKQIGENLWEDTNSNRVFYQILKDVPEREARTAIAFYISGNQYSGYKRSERKEHFKPRLQEAA